MFHTTLPTQSTKENLYFPPTAQFYTVSPTRFQKLILHIATIVQYKLFYKKLITTAICERMLWKPEIPWWPTSMCVLKTSHYNHLLNNSTLPSKFHYHKHPNCTLLLHQYQQLKHIFLLLASIFHPLKLNHSYFKLWLKTWMLPRVPG
jgi:hypothetical protein